MATGPIQAAILCAIITVVATIAFDAAARDRGVGALSVAFVTGVGGTEIVVVTVSICEATVRRHLKGALTVRSVAASGHTRVG